MSSHRCIKRSIARGAFVVLASTFCASVFANPLVTGITLSSQGLVDGATAIISGSGFGAKSPAAPYLWAPMTGGAVGTTPQPSSLGQHTTFDADGGNSGVGFMQYSNAITAPDGVSTVAYGAFGTLGNTDTSNVKYFVTMASNGFTWNDPGAHYYVYYKMWKNFSVENSHNLYGSPGVNYKSLRAWATSGTGPDFYLYPFNGGPGSGGAIEYPNGVEGWYATPGPNGNNDSSTQSVEGPTNQWFSQQIIWKSNSSYSTTTDGSLDWFVNGQHVASLPMLAWPGGPTWYWDVGDTSKNMNFSTILHLYIQGVFENEPAFPWNGTAFAMADVYVDNSWSRVMIGNAPTWSGNTVTDIEIPTSWSDTSISVVLHNDSFPNFNGAYLYVVDSNGNVNANGYAICGSCPQPPTNLTAN